MIDFTVTNSKFVEPEFGFWFPRSSFPFLGSRHGSLHGTGDKRIKKVNKKINFTLQGKGG